MGDYGNFPDLSTGHFPFPLSEFIFLKGGMDLVRKLILDRMKDLELNMAQVSRMLGRNETYMQNFLKTKGSPRELHERERRMLADILKVPEIELRGPSVALPARKYERSVSNSLASDSHSQYRGIAESKILQDKSLTIGTAVDLPVYGTVPGEGSNVGGFKLLDSPVDWAVRPPMLTHVSDAYAVIVPRTVMEPVIKAGTIVLYNPHLPPRIGDVCLLRSNKEDGVYIKGAEFRGETADSWKVRQLNPLRDFGVKKSEWQLCHRAIGVYFT